MSRRAPTARRALLCGASASALLLSAPAAGRAPVILPDVPDLPWLWSNARAAIQGLPVQGYRLTTAATLAARRAEEAGDVVRAHNLYLVASVAVQQQIDGLGIEAAWNTQVYPDAAALASATGGLA